ncbi:hypothetical protein K3495_g10899 [Podosphaera aphanis]|nr:hypothetical protein K3495_g10899 [Podosphaera aphanis]
MTEGLPNHIEQLKGQSSYRIWSVQIRSVLQSKGLWPYVLGGYSEPEMPEEGETKREFNARLKEYTIDKAKATGILQQSLSKYIILDVEFLDDPEHIWNFLESKYEPNGLAYQFSMYQEWQSIQYDGKDLEDFIHKYTQACSQLKESKVDVSDTIKLYQFITIISPWYENFAATIRDKLRNIKNEKDLPLLDDVISTLLDEEKAQQYCQAINFARKEKSKPINESSQKRESSICSHCRNKHAIDNCWHLNPEKAPKSFRPRRCNELGCKLVERYEDHEFKENVNTKTDGNFKPNRNFYTKMPKNSNFLDFSSAEPMFNQPSLPSSSTPTIPESAVKALISSESTNSWILDSGASTHFTHDLANMFDYQACDVRIEFGKGSAKALAYGSIRLTLVGDKIRTVTF